VDRSGKEEEIPAPRNEYMYPKISPDGTRVAFTLQTEGNYDIWLWDFIRKTLTRLSFHKEADVTPIWTHDSKRIIFCSTRDGSLVLYRKAADGTGKDEKIISIPDRGLIPYSIN
jgi:Tol biopolymer transport system component